MMQRWGKATKITSIPPALGTALFDIYRIFIKDDGTFPNNEEYPALLYKSAFMGTEADGRRMIMEGGDWTPPWVWGIFSYHHYHSKAWELLLCIRGEASVQFGGNSGPTVTVAMGDLVFVPPGLAHKQMNEKNGFALLGSYPTAGFDGSIDTLTGPPTKEQRERIAKCHVPERDPFFHLDIHKLCKLP